MWFVYILVCSDDSLYTGITTDTNRRLREHNSGKGSKYVRSRCPANIIWVEPGHTRSSALKREAKIKSFSRKEKLQLVDTPL